MPKKPSRKQPNDLSGIAAATHSYQQLLVPLGDEELIVLVADARGVVARIARLPAAHHVGLERAADVARLTIEAVAVSDLDTARSLTPSELALLGPRADSGPAALERSARAMAKLVASSLKVREAARLLRLRPAQIHRRVAAGALWGIKDGASWRLPRLQFFEGRQVAGLELVLPKLRRLHPLSLLGWLTHPHPDLELEDGRGATPMQWLIEGRDVKRVVGLAELLR